MERGRELFVTPWPEALQGLRAPLNQAPPPVCGLLSLSPSTSPPSCLALPLPLRPLLLQPSSSDTGPHPFLGHQYLTSRPMSCPFLPWESSEPPRLGQAGSSSQPTSPALSLPHVWPASHPRLHSRWRGRTWVCLSDHGVPPACPVLSELCTQEMNE